MSWQARVLAGVLRAASHFAPRNLDRVRDKLQQRGHTGGSAPGKLKGVHITTWESHGMTIVRLTPSGAAPTKTVFYCHGGSYCYEAAGLHWQFLRRLVLETQAAFEVPMYPLAPVDTAGSTVPAVTAVLAGLSPSVVMGDSAGGGLALAVLQQLRDQGAPQPDKLILIAPWLDVRTADPRQRELERGDLMLRVSMLQAAGQMYAGELPLDHPFVTPVLGDLRGLPPISLFVGTRDMLSVDAQELVRRCREVGTPLDLIEAPGMQHVYPILPFLPEATQARADIAALIRSTT